MTNGTSLSFGRSVWPLAAHEGVTAVWLHRMAVLDMPACRNVSLIEDEAEK